MWRLVRYSMVHGELVLNTNRVKTMTKKVYIDLVPEGKWELIGEDELGD